MPEVAGGGLSTIILILYSIAGDGRQAPKTHGNWYRAHFLKDRDYNKECDETIPREI